MTLTCAIHQPNFLPRLSTLAKLLPADIWVVLDDVQFVRRDYQHRARLAALDDPAKQRWLSIDTHLPQGRATRIRDVQLVDPECSARRVYGLLHEYYGRSPNRTQLIQLARVLSECLATGRHLHEVTTLSMELLLELCGWSGDVVRSSDLKARPDRSQRLADLTHAVGASTYLCGTGGAQYLSTDPFTSLDLQVEYFSQPTWLRPDIWQQGKGLSAVWTIAKYGTADLRGWQDARRAVSDRSRSTTPLGVPLAPAP